MVERIDLILKAKNITARQFAEEIGIQPSNMSHIMSGRNNPSLDFVMKVMRRWPEININWLMFGKGEMFTDPVRLYGTGPDSPVAAVQPSTVTTEAAPTVAEPDLFTQPVVEETPLPTPPVPAPVAEPQPVAVQPSVPQPPAESHPAPAPDPVPQRDENRPDAPVPTFAAVQPNVVHKRVVKLIVLYDDNTFAEYRHE